MKPAFLVVFRVVSYEKVTLHSSTDGRSRLILKVASRELDGVEYSGLCI